MKAILMSVQPKWCELIASGKKIIEVRKTKPKLDVPFKVYMYCTKNELLTKSNYNGSIYVASNKKYQKSLEKNGNVTLSGKVIGEFVCDNINTIELCREDVIEVGRCEREYVAAESACMNYNDFLRYLGGRIGYGYHISDLVIYDKPKELSEFNKLCKTTVEYEGEICSDCLNCDWCIDDDYAMKCDRSLARPPQSWCYVEEVQV